MYYCECKQKLKTGEAWEQGYVVRPVFASTLLANLVNPMWYFNVSVQVYKPEPEGELLSSKLTLGCFWYDVIRQ